ncbi:MAG TPA: glycosyltransferase [Candidatus Angelobacter sp.]|jgi:lipopolysaccharide biosynthesis glycosyltransferase|nr:glycosyltransferase [Candidatus Angelobacter sp.]
MSSAADRVAIYCTSDAGYALPSLVALASLRRFHPEHSYFLVADREKIHPSLEKTIRDQDVELVHFDDRQLFSGGAHLTRECYWKFLGPKLFSERGFRYSMSIDGDILCVRPFHFAEVLPRVEGYAGIRRNESPRSWTFRYPDWVQQHFQISPQVMEGDYTNTGVLIWNNQRMMELGLLERAIACYRVGCRVHPRMFRVGDQSLMALISEIHPRLPWFVLPAEDNFRVYSESERCRLLDSDSIRLIHYSGCKPWRPDSLMDCFRNAGKPAFMHRMAFKAKWESFVEDTMPFWRDLSMKEADPVRRITRGTRYTLLDLARQAILSRVGVFTICRLRGLLGYPLNPLDTGWSRNSAIGKPQSRRDALSPRSSPS